MMKNRNLVAVFLLLAITTIVFSFQNCGELRPSQSAVRVQASVESRFKKDKEAVAAVLGSPKLKAWHSARESSITMSEGLVTKVDSLLSGYPMEVPAGLAGPRLVDSAALGGKVFEFTPDSLLITTSSDMPVSTMYSVIYLMESAPTELAVGRLLTLKTTSNMVAELGLTFGSGAFKALNYFDSNNYLTLGETAYSLSRPQVVAMTFNENAERVQMQINGLIVRNTATKTGNPPLQTSAAQRHVAIGQNHVRVAEVLVVLEALDPAELNAMSRFVAERWGFNEVQIDPSLLVDEDAPDPDRIPPDVKRIISSCQTTSCHAGWASYGASYFRSQGYLVPGNYLGSSLYNRLQGSEGSNQNKTMPQGSSQLPAADLAAVKDWILNMQ